MKFFSLIEDEDVHIAPDKKKIPAAEFSKLVEAKTILEKVKEEEIQYRKIVSQECEMIKEQAETAGFETGQQQWNKQVQLLDKEIKVIRAEIENSMVPLALTAVKRILGRELKTDPDTVVDIISTALKAVIQHKKIKIFVNPSDLKTVEASRARIRDLFERLDSLSIVPREDIEEGGCIIETEAGIINAQLESQLKALEQAFHAFFQNQNKKRG